MEKFSSFVFVIVIILFLPINAQSQSQNQSLKIQKLLLKEGFAALDISELKISDQYYSASLDLEHIYYQQYYLDIPIENAILNTGLRGETILHSNNTLAKNITINPTIVNSILSPQKGLTEALSHLGKTDNNIPPIKNRNKNSQGLESSLTFAKGDISKRDVEVSLIWIKEKNSIRLCWMSSIEVMETSTEWYQIMIDARTGDYVKKNNLVIECTFENAECTDNKSLSKNINKNETSRVSLSNSYTVFDLPVESPNHGSRTITSNPWNRAGGGNPATTLGWHNDGISNYTITKGNNVYAYEDQDGNNAAGSSPDGGGSLDFNYSFDPSLPPASNVNAAITNLFHTCNLIHDVMYQYGFDEAAGNFQFDNLGRGGTGGDHVIAEGLDGGGTNNANFSTPVDGGNGRMQMFLWSAVTPPPDVVVNTPMTINSPINAVESVFSANNKLIDVGAITSNIVLAVDMAGSTHEACTANPINNELAISGNIAMIDRGTCDFVEKVKNAQDAGAIAAIVVNNNPIEAPIPMGGTDDLITIPAIMISYDDGQQIKTTLLSEPVNITMTGGPVSTPDGSYDNGIIIHEYGHGISTRLTGGPGSSGCLGNDEQMGEGWSDFYGLMLTTDWTDPLISATDRRGIGTYVQGEPTNGTGIRTYPYTTDIVINPFTYADVANAPVFQGQVSPHYIGSIWATMLWDMTWNIIDIEGVSSDLYHGSAGNNIALNLVTNGLKLQPCSPGFVDGRDAILLADEMLYGGKYKCAIWEAFARRGLGANADQGASTSYTDGTTSFDVPDEGVRLFQTTNTIDAIEGEIVTFNSEGVCGCIGKNNIQIKESIPQGYSLISILEGSQSGNQIISSNENLQPLDTVRLSYQARIDLCIDTPPINVFQDNVEGNDFFSSSKLAGTGNIKWVKSSAQSNSSSNSWYAQDYSSLADIGLTIDSPVAISGPTLLSFYHKYETEDPFDGGVVEVSADNGANWKDLGDDFLENGYPTTITTVGTDSRITGQPAFTGNSANQFGTPDFIKSVISLCNYDGQSILIRFRFVCDGGVGGPGINGWFVDDISIDQVSGIITDTELYQNNSFQNVISTCVQVKALNQNILYVDNSAGGSRFGGDWANAYLSLQDALQVNECNNIDTIYLAEGTYFPNDNRDTSFSLISNVVVMGGFPSGGGHPINRNPTIYQSILSGDIGASGNNSDNNYHVVYCGAGISNAVLDGLVIENGNADGEEAKNKGSAIYNLGSLTLINVSTQNNSGSSDIYNNPTANLLFFGDNRIN